MEGLLSKGPTPSSANYLKIFTSRNDFFSSSRIYHVGNIIHKECFTKLWEQDSVRTVFQESRLTH